MRFFRSERVQNLVHVELAKILIREMEFPDALLTVTGVSVDKKLEHARVEVSVIPTEAAPAVLAALHKSTPRLQHLLMKKINIKPMPRIMFALDRGPENAAAVEKALLKK